MAISLSRGYIVWVNGPFACGDMRDIDIFRGWIKQELYEGEMVLADHGYPDHTCCAQIHGRSKRESKTFLSRHESCNGRIKNFYSMSTNFRHSHQKHSLCFHAIAKLVQISIMCGHKLFEI